MRWLLCCCLIVVCTGCGKDHEDIYAGLLEVQNEIKSHLESVLDGGDVAVIAENIRNSVAKLKELEAQAKRLGAPTQEAEAELRSQYDAKLESAAADINKLLEKIKEKDEVTFKTLKTELFSLQTAD